MDTHQRRGLSRRAFIRRAGVAVRMRPSLERIDLSIALTNLTDKQLQASEASTPVIFATGRTSGPLFDSEVRTAHHPDPAALIAVQNPRLDSSPSMKNLELVINYHHASSLALI